MIQEPMVETPRGAGGRFRTAYLHGATGSIFPTQAMASGYHRWMEAQLHPAVLRAWKPRRGWCQPHRRRRIRCGFGERPWICPCCLADLAARQIRLRVEWVRLHAQPAEVLPDGATGDDE